MLGAIFIPHFLSLRRSFILVTNVLGEQYQAMSRPKSRQGELLVDYFFGLQEISEFVILQSSIKLKKNCGQHSSQKSQKSCLTFQKRKKSVSVGFKLVLCDAMFLAT